MPIDLTPFFEKYEELLKAADAVFEKVEKEFPECVKCRQGCADCCHALFDLTLIEALYINHHFRKIYDNRPDAKAVLVKKANAADRQVYKIKRNAFKKVESGTPEEDVLAELAMERIRCPLLNENNRCDMYDYRPITCRFYGIPTAIGGKGHTCGLSGFKPGEAYPTVNLDAIQQRLTHISQEIVETIQSQYVKMGDMLVPLSMALLTIYDDEYLGLADEDAETTPQQGEPQ